MIGGRPRPRPAPATDNGERFLVGQATNKGDVLVLSFEDIRKIKKG
jgi:hypothetical protein